MSHALELFGFTISMYFLSSIVGIIFAMGLALLRSRATRFHTSAEDIFFTVLCCVIGALLGAKVFQLMGNIILDGGNPGFWTLENWQGMLPGVGVFYGGLIGGFFLGLLYVCKSRLDAWEVIDIVVPSVPMFHILGRLGCFFVGCCYGHISNSSVAINGLIPVQLFEAGFNLLILVAMLFICPERKQKGVLLPLYLMAYATGRFVLEFFRGDVGRGIFLLSTSQWISLLVFPAGAILFLWTMRNNIAMYKTTHPNK